MTITYDIASGALRIALARTAVQESDEVTPGAILDYDADGNVVGVEVLDASRRTENPLTIAYTVVGKAT